MTRASPSRRNAAIVGGVVMLHVAGLWALQSGLVRRTLEIVVPAAILTDIITPPAPAVEQPKPVPTSERVAKPVRKPAAAPAPTPLAAPEAPPSPTAPLGAPDPQPVIAPIQAPVALAPAATPAPPKVEPPSSSADYLQNPAPVYPALSRRMGEQGQVIVRVLIGVDGRPLGAELKTSSGYERLDRSALEYVMKCRYVPGKVGGVPREMWHEAPVNYVLQ